MGQVQDVTDVWLADGSGEVQVALPGGAESELQGAMAGALAGAVQQAVEHLAIGSVQQIIVEAADGTLLVATGAQGLTMIVRARHSVNLGLLRLEARKARERLAQFRASEVAAG
ncbi:MAG: hypothetical protein CL878_10790 [Dehalococcoidia bacterium]|nr:hypothetical protein [Dehalococcoidia bacterium]